MNRPQASTCPRPTKPLSHLPPCCHRALALGSLHHTPNSHWLSILHMVMYMFQCYCFKSSHPLLLPLCPKICSLCLCLLCCPARRTVVSTVFLDSIYIILLDFNQQYVPVIAVGTVAMEVFKTDQVSALRECIF